MLCIEAANTNCIVCCDSTETRPHDLPHPVKERFTILPPMRNVNWIWDAMKFRLNYHMIHVVIQDKISRDQLSVDSQYRTKIKERIVLFLTYTASIKQIMCHTGAGL